MTKTFHRRALMTAAAASAVAGAAWGKDDARAHILTGSPPHLPGPKRTIAVGQIDVIGPYANASATNVGGAIAAMLTTALEECEAFLVIERDALAGVITEQELAKSGVSGGNAAPQPGRILPAQYLVVGSVTDFTASGAGSGGGLSIGGSTALTLGGAKGVVGLDLRVIDTRTTQLVTSFKVRHSLNNTTVGVSGSWKGVPVASNGFFNTPLGDATRKALNDAVMKIIAALAGVPWHGQVVEVEGGMVYVNAGAEAGVVVGDRLSVQRVAKTFTDPATGQVLSERTAEIGVVTITNVEPKMASGSYQGAEQPARGDMLTLQR